MTANAEPRWRTVFLAWLGLFAGIAFLLWVAIEFWGRNLRFAVSPGTAATHAAGGVRVMPPPNNAPVMSLEEVTESSARLSFVGRMVRFHGVKVTEVGRSSFRVGRDGGNTLLVTPSQPKHPDVQAGERVNLQGLILNVPGAAVIQRHWNLDATQSERAEREQIYLRASTVEKL